MKKELNQQAQTLLLSNSKDINKLMSLADELTLSNSIFSAKALLNKAFYLDVKNDHVLAKYISFLTTIGEHREALDFLIHANYDISESVDRRN